MKNRGDMRQDNVVKEKNNNTWKRKNERGAGRGREEKKLMEGENEQE